MSEGNNNDMNNEEGQIEGEMNNTEIVNEINMTEKKETEPKEEKKETEQKEEKKVSENNTENKVTDKKEETQPKITNTDNNTGNKNVTTNKGNESSKLGSNKNLSTNKNNSKTNLPKNSGKTDNSYVKTDNSKAGDLKKEENLKDKKSPERQTEFSSSSQTTVKYTPLNRYDFDMNIIDSWCELRTKSTPKRRCHHTSFIYNDYLYVFGGIDINEGKLNDFSKISLTSDDPVWENIVSKGTIPEPIAYHEGAFHNNKYYVFCGENEKQLPINSIYIYSLDTNTWELKKLKVNRNNIITNY